MLSRCPDSGVPKKNTFIYIKINYNINALYTCISIEFYKKLSSIFRGAEFNEIQNYI